MLIIKAYITFYFLHNAQVSDKQPNGLVVVVLYDC